MKRSRLTDQQIAFALQQAEQGTQAAEVTRKMGNSEQTFYRWKKKFGGLMPSEVRKLRQLEEENARQLRFFGRCFVPLAGQVEVDSTSASKTGKPCGTSGAIGNHPGPRSGCPWWLQSAGSPRKKSGVFRPSSFFKTG